MTELEEALEHAKTIVDAPSRSMAKRLAIVHEDALAHELVKLHAENEALRAKLAKHETPSQCGTTHYSGCACHEALWEQRLNAEREEVIRLRSDLSRTIDLNNSLSARLGRMRDALEISNSAKDVVKECLKHQEWSPWATFGTPGPCEKWLFSKALSDSPDPSDYDRLIRVVEAAKDWKQATEEDSNHIPEWQTLSRALSALELKGGSK